MDSGTFPRLCQKAGKALKAPEVVKRPQDLRLDAGGITPVEMTANLREDIPRLEKIVGDSARKWIRIASRTRTSAQNVD